MKTLLDRRSASAAKRNLALGSEPQGSSEEMEKKMQKKEEEEEEVDNRGEKEGGGGEGSTARSAEGAREAQGQGPLLRVADLRVEEVDDLPVPRTPPRPEIEQHISPKSLTMSPNVKALGSKGEGSKKSAATSESRRQQLIEHTASLWRIMDDVCEHSALPPKELAGTSERIRKLKAMNDQLGSLESEMEALHSVYTFESKSYLKKLRHVEREVYSQPKDKRGRSRDEGGPGDGDDDDGESESSFGQAALDRSFARSVFKILYDDKKGLFQLVSARLEGEKAPPA